MTKAEVAKLLAIVQAFDRRTVGEADVTAWHEVARLAGWRPEHAFRAVTEHFSSGGEWLTPGHVTDRIRAARRDISRRIFTRDITPPAELGADLQAELRWRRETVPAIIDRHLDDWARTGALPEPTNQVDPVSVEGQARLAELLGRTGFARAVTR